MDDGTRLAYDGDAAGYAAEWLFQPPPTDLYALLRKHFSVGPTIDVGCGAGRDVHWLESCGYPTVGVDASEQLLALARAAYPGTTFLSSELPALDELGGRTFTNVLCETVIMHLPEADVVPAVSRLSGLLAPGGTLYLSWRVSRRTSRDPAGRLYAAVDADAVREALGPVDVLHDETVIGASSGKQVRKLVARAPDRR